MDLTAWVLNGLTVFSTLWAIGSTIFAIRSERRRKKERKTRQQLLRWDDIYTATVKAKEWLERNRYPPDVAVVVPGGSVMMAGILQLEFGTKPLVVQIDEYDQVSNFDEDQFLKVSSRKWNYLIPRSLAAHKGSNVIVPVVYSHFGSTLRCLEEGLRELGFDDSDFKTISLFNVKGLDNSTLDIDYTGVWFDSHDLYFPWGHISRRARRKLET